ncbi:hypothetical protein QBC38DRAFT_522446, partial [Podospora fimiseda]
ILERAVARYKNFFSLLSNAADHQLVPTVDIDLVWHTHQLSPTCYALFSTSVTQGRLVNHVDSVEDALIQTGFERTESLYHEVFGEDYSICCSWLCEVMRVKGEALLAKDDLTPLRAIISRLNQQSLQLGLSIVLYLAECRCYEDKVSSQSCKVEIVCGGCSACGTQCIN